MASEPSSDPGRDDRAVGESRGAAPQPVDAATKAPAANGDPAAGEVRVDRSEFSPRQGLFVVEQGAEAGARYLLDSDLVSLGRDPRSDIFLDDITVSRRHAEVARDGDRYSIRDVGSLNGTYINRTLVDRCRLNEGDEVQVGKFKLVFVRGTSGG
ncbi:MAG: FHA domain-containing protein [Acidimicrobiaceae bacterium]|nr:FHA domain-containing protein [Acidimicrobiaceae bacterium]MCY4280969.1 FHA domain-containing protein [Acidimicrobiaceae bacterium]MCY4295165.1 FHA domain-containing protein [Acidimicrobiaceae bacterium]